MNKKALQAILFSVIAVSLVYAFVPIDSASTAHTSFSSKNDTTDVMAVLYNAIDDHSIATDAIGADELATSAVKEIGSLDRSFFWHLKTSTNPIQNMVLIPELPGNGSVILTQISGADEQTRCIIETGDGTQILNGGNKNSSTDKSLASYVGEQIQIDIDADMECTVTVYLTDNSGNP